jgi:hypothetical protein
MKINLRKLLTIISLVARGWLAGELYCWADISDATCGTPSCANQCISCSCTMGGTCALGDTPPSVVTCVNSTTNCRTLQSTDECDGICSSTGTSCPCSYTQCRN